MQSLSLRVVLVGTGSRNIDLCSFRRILVLAGECRVLPPRILAGHAQSGSHLSLPPRTHPPAAGGQEVGCGTVPFLGPLRCCSHSGHLLPRCCSLPWAHHSAAPRAPAQPCPPFPVPQFLIRPQGVRRQLFGPDASALSSQGERRGGRPGRVRSHFPPRLWSQGAPCRTLRPRARKPGLPRPCWRGGWGEVGRGLEGGAWLPAPARSHCLARPLHRCRSAPPPHALRFPGGCGVGGGDRERLQWTLRTRAAALLESGDAQVLPSSLVSGFLGR